MDYKALMESALYRCTWSKDPSVQNGAIVVSKDGNIIGDGYNSLTVGVKNNKSKWERPQKYMWVEHAERNAIFNAAYMGYPLRDAILVCPWAACCDCARAIVQSGIRTLVRFPMPEADGWQESIQIGEEILEAGGVMILELNIEDFNIPKDLRLGQFRDA